MTTALFALALLISAALVKRFTDRKIIEAAVPLPALPSSPNYEGRILTAARY